MKKISIILLAIILVVTVFTGTAGAKENLNSETGAPSIKKDGDIKLKHPTKEQKEIELIVIQADMEARDEAYKELAPMYSNGGYLEDTVEFQDSVQAKIDKKIEKYGIKRIVEKESSEFGIMSSPPTTQISINTPVIYSSSQGYFIKASATWKRDSWGEPYWMKHRASFGSDMGGDDGFGVFFGSSTNIEISRSSFYTADNFNKTYNTNLYPFQTKPSGVYYKAQDKVYTSLSYEYTWDKAYITVWPLFKGAVNTQVRSQWTHTWSSAEITGVTIGAGGISVNISNAAYSWNGASTYGATVKH